MKVTVEHNRKSVIITSFGSAPFSIRPDTSSFLHTNVIIIPHGFTVRTRVNQRWWRAATRVGYNNDESCVEYQFVCENDVERGTGDWCTNPTSAFNNANGPLKLDCAKFHKGTNGALLIGVTYSSVQHAIRQHFGFSDDPPTTPSPATTPATPHKVKRARTPPPPPPTPTPSACDQFLTWDEDGADDPSSSLLLPPWCEGDDDDDEWNFESAL